MTIRLDEPRTPGYPVVKRQKIGETFVGALVKQQQRPVLKDGEQVLKDDGKPRQELVLTLVAMPGTTAQAGLGTDIGVPEPGDLVRLILRGAAFGDWIEQRKTHTSLSVGDVVTQRTEYAQAYDANGRATGPKLTTQAQVNAVPRAQPVGIYGPITLRAPAAAEGEWVTLAEKAYLDERTPVAEELEPF